MERIQSRMSLCVVASSLLALFSSGAPCEASTAPTPAMMAPIKTLAAAVNADKATVLAAVYTPDAVIIDEDAPYRWEGPNAAANWLATLDKVTQLQKIKATARLGKPSFWDISPARAYIVVPTAYAGTMAGKPFTETGAWTFVLVKAHGVWKIETSTWAKTGMR